MSPDQYASGITKETLRNLLDQVPNNAQNAHLRQAFADLLSAQAIQPIPYSYTVPYFTGGAVNNILLGAVAQQGSLNVQSDADFLVLNQTFFANSLNAATTFNTRVVPNCTVLITDTGAGYNLMDQALPISQIFGWGTEPYILPEPKLFAAKATIQTQVTNFDAAIGYNLWLTFNGVKLFKY